MASNRSYKKNTSEKSPETVNATGIDPMTSILFDNIVQATGEGELPRRGKMSWPGPINQRPDQKFKRLLGHANAQIKNRSQSVKDDFCFV